LYPSRSILRGKTDLSNYLKKPFSLMKKQRMSLEKMRTVLSNVLSREEMKEVMAGSGGGGQCPTFCTDGHVGCSYYADLGGCRCDWNPLYYYCV
jgi:hypothetical protein